MLRSHIQKVNQVGWQEAYRVNHSSWQSLNFKEDSCSFESLSWYRV